MARNTDGIIIYKFNVEWKVFDNVGNELQRRSKPFETKKKAEDFVQKLKRQAPADKNIIAVIRELENDEIIRRYKKKSGNKNYYRSK